jgi:hypothetical protein
VEKRLGKPGSFGVAYKVIDTLGDVSRAMKLVLRDRNSTVDRLKKEYKTLLRIPDHPNVVKLIVSDFIPLCTTPSSAPPRKASRCSTSAPMAFSPVATVERARSR